MADDDKVLAAISDFRTEMRAENEATRDEMRLVSANFESMRNEVTNHGKLLVAHAAELEELRSGVRAGVAPIEHVAANPLPRPPMTTLDEINAGKPMTPRGKTTAESIRVIEHETRQTMRENRWLTVAVLVVVPIAIAFINNCGHH